MTSTESIKLRERLLNIVQGWEACGIENCDQCNGKVDMILDAIVDELSKVDLVLGDDFIRHIFYMAELQMAKMSTSYRDRRWLAGFNQGISFALEHLRLKTDQALLQVRQLLGREI